MTTDNNQEGSSGKKDDESKANGGENTDSDKSKNKEFVSVEEFNRVKKNHDDAFAKLRIAERKADDLEKQIKDSQTKKVEGEGNLEDIKKHYQADKTELEKKSSYWENKAKDGFKRSEITKLAKANGVLEAALDDVVSRCGEQMQVTIDKEDVFSLSVNDSHLDANDFIKKFLESKPYYCAPKGSGGSGAGKGDTDKTRETQMSLEQIDKLTPTEASALFKKDPKLAAAYLNRGRGR